MTAAVAYTQTYDVRTALTGASFAQLAARFDSLPRPVEAPLGVLRGEAVSLAGVERLPRGARQTLMRVLARVIAPLWRGKRIADDRGSNLWLPIGSPISFARFAVRHDPDGALRLDYDVPDNPRALRRIVGELRELAPGLYLGRMDVSAGGGLHAALYFTLEH